MSTEKEHRQQPAVTQQMDAEQVQQSKAAPAFQLKADAPLQRQTPPAGEAITAAAKDGAAAVTEEKFDPSKLKKASDYKSGAKAGSLYGQKQSSTLGHTLKTEKTKGTIGYSTSGKKFATKDDYYAAVDEKYAARNEKTNTEITDNQEELLDIARNASKDSAYFDDVINNSAAAKAAEVNYSGAMLANDSYTFSPLLKERIARFHKFMVAVGLYTQNKPKIGSNAALRNRPVAHKWSTEHYITQGKNQSVMMGNFKKMYDDASHVSGSNIIDKDGITWAKKSHFVDKAGAATTDMSKVDESKTFANIKAFVNLYNFRSNKASLASEGYSAGDQKRWPNADSVGISNHIFGNALDLPTAGFVYKADVINDFIAWEFGLQRNVSGETWHFECTGMPQDATTEKADDKG